MSPNLCWFVNYKELISILQIKTFTVHEYLEHNIILYKLK